MHTLFATFTNTRLLYSSSDSEEEIYSLLHLNNLQPYDFEPDGVVSVDNAALRENEGTLFYENRIGHINWCICGNCQQMETDGESRWCREADEVPEEYFSGHDCVTGNENIFTVCLNKEVQKQLYNMRGDGININNRPLLYAGYR